MFSSAVRRSVINVAPSNTTGRVGDTVELACTANESQVANIQWLKNDDALDTTVSRYILLPSGTLRIRNLRRSDAGKYVCTLSGAVRPQTVAATYVTIKGLCCPHWMFRKLPARAACFRLCIACICERQVLFAAGLPPILTTDRGTGSSTNIDQWMHYCWFTVIINVDRCRYKKKFMFCMIFV